MYLVEQSTLDLTLQPLLPDVATESDIYRPIVNTSGFEELGASQSQTPIQSESQSNQSKTVYIYIHSYININSVYYISQYYPYSILHINLTLTLSLPYLRLACAELSLGPIIVNLILHV